MEDAAALLPGCRPQPGMDREAGWAPRLILHKHMSNKQQHSGGRQEQLSYLSFWQFQ
jgi:hypothetical protein